MTNETRERAFNALLAEIVSKRWTPLMDDNDVRDANELLSKAAQSQTATMKTAITLFNPPKYMKNRQHNLKVLKLKLDFITARYNGIKTYRFRNLVPTYTPPHHKDYIFAKRHIESRDKLHSKFSLRWLYRAVDKIERKTDAAKGKCGWETHNFFRSLTNQQRMDILGAVFDQYPLWLVTKFREREARSVDFKQIWSPVDSPDRVAFRTYYREMFVCMGDFYYQVHYEGVLGGNEKELKKGWEEFHTLVITNLNLGGPESLPMA